MTDHPIPDLHHEDKQKKSSAEIPGSTIYLPEISMQEHKNREALRYPNWQMPAGRRR